MVTRIRASSPHSSRLIYRAVVSAWHVYLSRIDREVPRYLGSGETAIYLGRLQQRLHVGARQQQNLRTFLFVFHLLHCTNFCINLVQLNT